ncbi:DUF4232 domain-containing protein [Cellulosimicrobium terreum]|nr:DUF4232 domain-containing protein [Cellulosimicrobium terreum]
MDDDARPRWKIALGVAAGVVLAVGAAVVGPRVLPDAVGQVPRSSPPASVPRSGHEGLADALRALDGVADVTVPATTASLGQVTVTLDQPLPAPADAQLAADTARDLVAAAYPRDGWTLTVSGTASDGATLRVALPGPVTGEAGEVADLGTDPVGDAVALADDPRVLSVVIEGGWASALVATNADLVPVVDLATDLDRGLSDLTVDGYAVGYFAGDMSQVPPRDVVALLAAAAERSGVVQVAYEATRSTLPSTPLLTVRTEDGPDAVADWLEDVTHDGEPLPFQVHGATDDDPAAVRSGYVAGTKPRSAAAGATTCEADLLTLGAAWFDAASGRRFLTITASNRDDTPCVLAGSPDLRFVASDGNEQEVLVEPDTVAVGSPVTLAPGDRAQSTLSWRGGPTADGPALVTSLLVAPVPGSAESVVPFADVPGAQGGLDLLDGATATVTPWAPWVEPGEP